VPAGSTPPPSADGRPPRAGEGGASGGGGRGTRSAPRGVRRHRVEPRGGGGRASQPHRGPRGCRRRRRRRGAPAPGAGPRGGGAPGGARWRWSSEGGAPSGPGGGELVHEGLLGGREADAHHEGGALVFGLAGAGHEGSLAPPMAVVQQMFHVKHLRQTTTPPRGQDRDPSRAPSLALRPETSGKGAPRETFTSNNNTPSRQVRTAWPPIGAERAGLLVEARQRRAKREQTRNKPGENHETGEGGPRDSGRTGVGQR
jgi:hypothetical protein